MSTSLAKILCPVLSLFLLVCLAIEGQTAPLATTTSLSASIVGGPGRQNVRMIATVSADHIPVTSGQVTFLLNGRPLGASQVVGSHGADHFAPGTATAVFPLPEGPYSVIARYSGTSKWNASTSAATTVVVPFLAQAKLTIRRPQTSGEPYSYLLTSTADVGSLTEPLYLSDLSSSSLIASVDLTGKKVESETLQRNDVLGFPGSAFVIADLSGDGTRDHAICNSTNGSVLIYMEQPDGSHVLTQSIPTGAQPTAIVAVDLNGDGLRDLAVVNTGDGTVSVILQDTSHPGIFLPAVNEQVGSMPGAIAFGDFNDDGMPDLAVANFADDTISILLGSPASPGTFSVGPVINTQNGPAALAVGDLTQQGRSDIVVASYYDGIISVFASAPRTNDLFSPPKFVNRTGNGPRAISIGDINGDGLVDIVTANTMDGTISVLPAIASIPGAFPTQYVVNGFYQPTSIEIVWSAGSKTPDIAVGDGSNGSITILKNDGSARFLQRSIHSVGAGLVSVHCAGIAASPESYSLVALDPSLGRVEWLAGRWSLSGSFPEGMPLAANVLHKLQASYHVVAYGNLDSNVIPIIPKPKQSQSIQFQPPSSSVYGGPPITLSATASSQLPVQFSIKAGNATLSGNTLTIRGAGLISVQADQPGNSTYGAAHPVVGTIYIHRVPLTVTPDPSTRTYGAVNPVFTGHITGLIGGDMIYVAYSSAAALNTPPGIYTTRPYGITASVSESAVSGNYDLKTTTGALTICPTETGARSETTAVTTLPPGCPVANNSPGTPNHLPRPTSTSGQTPTPIVVPAVLPKSPEQELAGSSGSPGPISVIKVLTAP